MNASIGPIHKPTDAQAKAGNYRKGHVRIHGLDVTIENRKGSRRRPEWPPLAAHYGYIKRTTGKDGDHVDIFLGPFPDSELVVVIDQVGEDGKFDEHKCMLGFRSSQAATNAYRSSYTAGWKIGMMTMMTIQQFKNWLQSGNQQKPVADQVSKYAAKPDSNDRWITVNGGDGDGQPVLIDHDGTIKAGLGGKFNGKKVRAIDDSKQPQSAKRSQRPAAAGKTDGSSLKQKFAESILGKIKDFEASKPQREAKQQQAQSERESHPHHLSQLGEELRKALLDWHVRAHQVVKPVLEAEGAARVTGGDVKNRKRQAWEGSRREASNDPEIQELRNELNIGPSYVTDPGVNKQDVQAMAKELTQLIAQHAPAVDLKPFVRHNNIIPRVMAAKMKPNDSLFRPVQDHERFAAAMAAAFSEYYAARKPKNSPGQMGLFGDGLGGNQPLRSAAKQQRLWDEQGEPVWRTINGAKVLIQGGKVIGGAGGKLNGRTVRPKKKPVKNSPYIQGGSQAFGPDGLPASGSETTSKPKPGIADNPLENDKAVEGDQLGLIDGEGKRKPRPKLGNATIGKGKQGMLLGGLDALPGQMDMFGGDGTPDDLVLGGGESTPREKAESETESQKSDYAFARKSAIENAGEDLVGSARHIRNQWRTLEEAEENGSAEALVTRDKLLKNEPHSLAASTNENALTALAMHLALKAFPSKPAYGSGRRDDERKRKNRKQYVEAYREFKELAENAAKKSNDYNAALDEMRSAVGKKIDQLRGRTGGGPSDRYNDIANALTTTHKRLGNYGKTTIRSQMREVIASLPNASSSDYKLAEQDAALSIMEGKSIAQVTGKGKDTKERFDPTEAYVAIATREGGSNVPIKSAKDATDYLVNKVGLRGVQFGNSVSDKEREHHAIKAAEALVDLADVTGLPLNAISLDGKLGLAMGARGRAGALAHYEPGTKVINLTRKKGVGSLAHEWAHAFDHEMGGGELESTGFGKRAATFQSNMTGVEYRGQNVDGKWERTKIDHSTTTLGKPMAALKKAFSDSGYRGRLARQLAETKGMSMGKRQYWASNEEVFARCFERYVQHKLESNGRKNTYLAGIETKSYKSGGLWPTDNEIKKMAPAFDALMDVYRRESLGVADRVTYSVTDRQKAVVALIEQYRTAAQPKQAGKRSVVTGNQGDRGYFVTIGDNPVFIEVESGNVSRGPRSMKGKPVKSIRGQRLHRSKRIKPDRSGDRDSPGQIGAFGDGFGGEYLRRPGTQQKLPTDRFVPKTKADQVAVDAVGNDPQDVKHFRELMEDAHKMLTTEANETNDDLRNLLANFGYRGKKTSQIIQAVRRAHSRGDDATSISRFDEMVDMAKNSFPHLLAGNSGESIGADDHESGLWERLKQGFEKPPTKTDDRVIDLAKQMFASSGKPNDFDDEFDEDEFAREWGLEHIETAKPKDDFVPFSAEFQRTLTERYFAICG